LNSSKNRINSRCFLLGNQAGRRQKHNSFLGADSGDQTTPPRTDWPGQRSVASAGKLPNDMTTAMNI
jgi:hypothetical protein